MQPAIMLPYQVPRDRGDAQGPPDEHHEQGEQHGRADETVALADHGEDEVGVVLGQEVEHGLRGQVAAPAAGSGADGDHRLREVVAGAD